MLLTYNHKAADMLFNSGLVELSARTLPGVYVSAYTKPSKKKAYSTVEIVLFPRKLVGSVV